MFLCKTGIHFHDYPAKQKKNEFLAGMLMPAIFRNKFLW